MGSALERVQLAYKAEVEAETKHGQHALQLREATRAAELRVKEGVSHDGRLDCVAGNGAMSELGIGDESFSEKDTLSGRDPLRHIEPLESQPEPRNNISSGSSANALPTVIIKNYACKNARDRQDLLDALAKWAARLVNHKVLEPSVDNMVYKILTVLPRRPMSSL